MKKIQHIPTPRHNNEINFFTPEAATRCIL